MARLLTIDKVLYAAVMMLLALGLVMVYSATDPFPGDRWVGHLIAAVLGLLVLAATAQVDYRLLRRRVVLRSLSLAALGMLTLAGVLGRLPFDPAEVAKLVLIVFLAAQIERQGEDAGRSGDAGAPALHRLLLPAGLATALTVMLLMLQPDRLAAVLAVTVALVLIFLAGLPRWLFGLSLASALPALAFLLSGPVVGFRWRAFLNPELDPMGSGYQTYQSLIAVGSGGVFGLGAGGSLQKYYFLRQPYSDFLYAILAEELGLAGALAVLVLYLLVLWRGLLAGSRAPDLFGRHLAWGLTSLLVIQAFLHISVNLALAPAAGIPLPLLSYGGTSLVTSLAACGILLNISRHG